LGQFLITFSSGRPVHEVHHCETLTKAVASNLRLGTQLTGSSAISKCFASSVYTGAISALKKMIRLRFLTLLGPSPSFVYRVGKQTIDTSEGKKF
jgi:hypothetical protein